MTPKQKRLYLSILTRIAKKERKWEEEKEGEDVEMTDKGKEVNERERRKEKRRREWLGELLNSSSHPKLSVDGYDEKARNLEQAGEG